MRRAYYYNKDIEGYLQHLDSYSEQYSGKYIANRALHLSVGSLVHLDRMNIALDRINKVIQKHKAEKAPQEKVAWLLFERAMVYNNLEKGAGRLEKISNLNAENDLNEILNNYSATKAAEHVKILYGEALNKDRELASLIPEEFKISPPYPNPFNPTTTISFQLPAAMQVDIHVFNLMGQQVWSSKKKYQPGFRDIRWHAVDKSGQALSSGVYIIKVKAGNNISTQKAILMK